MAKDDIMGVVKLTKVSEFMNPLRLLFLLFLIVPMIEIYLLLVIGSIIGPLPTIFMVVFTAVVGAWLLRIEGFNTWFRLQQSLAQGKVPALEMVEGPILLVGGALLLTPGFFTDFLGFLCLLPSTRRRIAQYIIKRWMIQRTPGGPKGPSGGATVTIEGEFERKD